MEPAEFERFFSLSNDMLCITSHDGWFRAVNDTWCRTLGYERDELLATPFAHLIHPDDLGPTRAAVRRLEAGEPLSRFLNRYRHRDGSYRWLQWLATPSDTHPITYGVARDVTEQVELEARLEGALRARAEFISHMSHELRTPMNAILGFAELLEERAADRLEPREKQYLGYIREAGDHLLRLINEVLDLARVESGKIEFRLETALLDHVLAPVLASIALAAERAGLTFQPVVDRDVVVTLDAGRMEQVLLNLLSNAVKFTPAGGRVELRATQEGDDLVLTVSDTGIGVPADRQDRLFTPFERPNEGRSSAGGTGVGLSLAKQLVELQGGTLSFTSAEGVGTTFVARLPGAASGALSGPRLLIVEDEAHSARLVAAHASAHGLPSEIVGGVASALEAVRRDPPAGVVLDLHLPEVSGERFIEAVRGDAALADLPVLVVSVDDDIARSVSLGADNHLVKPVDPEALVRWLHRIVRPVVDRA